MNCMEMRPPATHANVSEGLYHYTQGMGLNISIFKLMYIGFPIKMLKILKALKTRTNCNVLLFLEFKSF